MHPCPRRRRGDITSTAVAGMVTLALLTLVVKLFLTSDEPPPREGEALYLGDLSPALAVRVRETSDQAAAQREQVLAARRRARFRHASAGEVFRSPGEGLAALRRDAWAPVMAPTVVLRLLGTPVGDFLLDSERGWLQFVDGRWVEIDEDQVPASILEDHPHLLGGAQGPPDGQAKLPAWMHPGSET